MDGSSRRFAKRSALPWVAALLGFVAGGGIVALAGGVYWLAYVRPEAPGAPRRDGDGDHGATFRRAPSPLTVEAATLLSELRANQAAAEKKYGGRELIVTGEVERVIKGADGSFYVALRGLRGDEVDCYPEKENQKALESLSPGDAVTVSGRLREYRAWGTARLDGCRVKLRSP